jgi:hypothetical protein
MKWLFFFILCLLFIPSMGQNIVRVPVNTPGGSMTLIHHTNTNRVRNSGIKSYGHDYKIKLVNDSVISKYTKININDSIHYIEFKKGKKEFLIKPADTKEIKFTTSSGYTYTGIPKDSCWLFKMRQGKISTYSYLPEFDPIYLIAIQKGNGEILPYTKENVIKMVEGNEEAVKHAAKGNLDKALLIYNGW